MNKLIFTSVLTASMFLSTPCFSQKNIEGIWSTKEGCDVLNYKGNDIHPSFDAVSFLTDNDVSGHEWICEFTQKIHDKHGRVIAVSSCAAEGDEWADIIMIIPRDKGWDLVIDKLYDNQSVVLSFPMQCKKDVE